MPLQLLVQKTYSLNDVADATSLLAANIPSATPFTKPFWLIPWLQQNEDKSPLWLQCFSGDTLVASVFVVLSPPKGLRSPFTCGWFNKTGDMLRDQIWIEFNDLLALPEWHDKAVRLVLNWCKSIAREWRLEITANPSPWLNHPDFFAESTAIPGYAVLLEPAFTSKDNYLAQCSSNTRSRIRRAIKYLQAHFGDITVRSFGSLPPEPVLEELARFHADRWQHTDQGSGFNNQAFRSFHQSLMRSSSNDPTCEILGFFAGDLCIGYTYNLISNDQVYFYLSGINYLESSNRFQPGLVLHTYAISYYAQRGCSRYDFMGGESQYKQSLSNHHYHLFMIRLLRKDWLTRLFVVAKALKSQIFNIKKQ